MKQIIAFLLLLILGKPSPAPSVAIVPTPTPEIISSIDGFGYGVMRIATPSSVTLIPNFREKKDSRALMQAHGCTGAVNGGFYTTSNAPLGLFRTDDHRYGEKIDSDLTDGFLWIDKEENAIIASEIPNESFRLALQTGPLLLFNKQALTLSIHNDLQARRMIAAKSADGFLLFVTVYNPNSVFDGPLLADLPEIIQKISDKERLHIADAINLDGGSASVFYHEKTSLSELTAVGSLFCIQ